MTIQTLAVLRALLEDANGFYYGLEIARQTGLKSGSLYPILIRLEKAGWIEGEWEDIDPSAAGRRPRRYYRLTPPGARWAATKLQQAAGLIGVPSEATSPESKLRWT